MAADRSPGARKRAEHAFRGLGVARRTGRSRERFLNQSAGCVVSAGAHFQLRQDIDQGRRRARHAEIDGRLHLLSSVDVIANQRARHGQLHVEHRVGRCEADGLERTRQVSAQVAC